MRERLDELIMIIEKAGNPTSFDYPSSLIPTIIKRSKNLQEVPKMGALRKKYNQQIIQEATVEKDQEITRLKELLGRCKQFIDGTGTKFYSDEPGLNTRSILITEIENELKP